MAITGLRKPMKVLKVTAVLFSLAGLCMCATGVLDSKTTPVQVQEPTSSMPTRCELMCEKLRKINCEGAANLSSYSCESWCPTALERGAWPDPGCVMDAENCGHVMQCPYASRGSK